MSDELKPCPFCGVYPTLYCDITNWRGQPMYAPYPNGYRPISYVLKASHRSECFIRHMNGMNEEGRIDSFNCQILIEYWNRRAKNANSD